MSWYLGGLGIADESCHVTRPRPPTSALGLNAAASGGPCKASVLSSDSVVVEGWWEGTCVPCPSIHWEGQMWNVGWHPIQCDGQGELTDPAQGGRKGVLEE